MLKNLTQFMSSVAMAGQASMDDLSGDKYVMINCTNLTVHQGNIAALTRGVTGIVCFVLCSLALLFQVVYICHLRHSNTLQRLFLYLTVSTVFYMGVLSLHLEHYFRYSGQETACVVIGVLDQYTGSVQLLLTLGITVVLFHKLLSLSETYQRVASRFKPSTHSKRLKRGYCYEATLCIISLLLPWAFIWVPFLSKRGSYGLSGPWCWIQSKDPLTCDKIARGILQQTLLWYAPYGLVAVVSFLCIFCVLIFFCYLRFHRRILEKQTQAVIKEMLLLLAFLVMFCVVWLVESTIRGVLNISHVDYFVLWMVYAIITPIGGIVVPIGFLVYLFCSKFSKPSSSPVVTVREYSNLQTGRDADRFIHNPSRISAASRTSDRDYKQFLTRSGETTTTDQETKPLFGSACTNGSAYRYLSTTETT